MNATDDVKATLKKTLEASLATAKTLLTRVTKELSGLEASEPEWTSTFKVLHAASARFPVRPWNRYYQHNLEPASEPLFVGIGDEPNFEYFGEITQGYLDELVTKYQAPAVAAIEAVFDDVTGFFRESASHVLTLRFFSNSEVLLKRFEAVLSPPWAKPIKVSGSPTQFQAPFWIGQPVHEHPPHLEIYAIRSAQIATLRILKQKLQEMIATLDTAITELPFAEKLSTPKSVPQTLIDYSTHIGANAKVDGSAIGQGSTKQS